MRTYPIFRWIVFGTAVIVGGLASRSAWGADLDPGKVREAIHWGAETLKQSQIKAGREAGSWPSLLNGDPTALCTLALLNSGEVKVSDPVIQRALNFLRNKALTNTYEVALEIMVFSAADPQWDDRTRPNPDLPQVHKRALWLVKTQIKEGDRSGMWSYGKRSTGGDNSNSQFALLGLYEADRTLQRNGQKSPIPESTWKLALHRWRTEQNDDGSWGYVKKGQGSGYGAMTCAGIASVVIASGRLNKAAASLEGDRVKCCGDPALDKAAIAVRDALAWLGNPKRFDVRTHPGGGSRDGDRNLLYYLYALERVGRMTARRYIGDRDWYREGAKFLVERQNRFRGWTGRGFGEDKEHIATSYALLFLSKGNQPTLLAKLQYGDDRDWNSHPLDAASLTQFVEQEWKRDLLSWHVVHATRATADDYMQSPIVYISGRKQLDFLKDDAQRAKVAKELREYIDRGGFIYAEACCDDSVGFDNDFKALMSNVFEPEHKLDLLREDHEIWFFEKPNTQVYRGWLWEIRKGCRTAVVYCVNPRISGVEGANADVVAPSCYWELQAGMGRDGKLPMDVQTKVDAAFSLGINILAYATGRKLKNKLEIPEKTATAQNLNLDRVILDIRQLRHDGGWNAAPGALVTLQRELNTYAGIQVPTDRREIDILDPDLFNHHMLFMHGRNGFSLSDKQREQLRKFVENGGMLFGDAVCASKGFADSFREEMKKIFPTRTMAAISADHKMFGTVYGGFDLKTVKLRVPPQRKEEGRPLKAEERDTPPELEGITFGNGRYGVVFSKYDLSCALEGHENVTCPGYTRPDAARIGINVVLYSLHE